MKLEKSGYDIIENKYIITWNYAEDSGFGKLYIILYYNREDMLHHFSYGRTLEINPPDLEESILFGIDILKRRLATLQKENVI